MDDNGVRQETGNGHEMGSKGTSLRRIEANRRNALRSTGPRTAKGKSVSRWNAVRHGLLSRQVVLRAGVAREHAEEFNQLIEQLRRDLNPRGVVEEMLVEKIATCYWRLRRVLRSESGAIRRAVEEIPVDVESRNRLGRVIDEEPTPEENEQ